MPKPFDLFTIPAELADVLNACPGYTVARSVSDLMAAAVRDPGPTGWQEVAFDVPHEDYSWMAYLAKAGFDVFSMDMTGYGRSSRPTAMNDPCNFSKDQQAQFVPALLSAPCSPSHPSPMTTLGSDWNDIGAVVDRLRALRHVENEWRICGLAAWGPNQSVTEINFEAEPTKPTPNQSVSPYTAGQPGTSPSPSVPAVAPPPRVAQEPAASPYPRSQ